MEHAPQTRMTMTSEEQLQKWVEGKSIHNENGNKQGGECCPDFSCCKPGLKWPKEKRELFANSDEKTQSGMLMGALRALMDYEEIRKVRIIT